MIKIMIPIILFLTSFANANTDLCQERQIKTSSQRQDCLSQLSLKYQQAEIAGDLQMAYNVITNEIEPFLARKDSSSIRTEELLMNLSRIKESLEQRIKNKQK